MISGLGDSSMIQLWLEGVMKDEPGEPPTLQERWRRVTFRAMILKEADAGRIAQFGVEQTCSIVN